MRKSNGHQCLPSLIVIVTKLAQKILYASTNVYLYLKQIDNIDKMLPHAHAST